MYSKFVLPNWAVFHHTLKWIEKWLVKLYYLSSDIRHVSISLLLWLSPGESGVELLRINIGWRHGKITRITFAITRITSNISFITAYWPKSMPWSNGRPWRNGNRRTMPIKYISTWSYYPCTWMIYCKNLSQWCTYVTITTGVTAECMITHRTRN